MLEVLIVSSSNCTRFCGFLAENIEEHADAITEIFNNHFDLGSGSDIEMESEEYAALLSEYKVYIDGELTQEERDQINEYFSE